MRFSPLTTSPSPLPRDYLRAGGARCSLRGGFTKNKTALCAAKRKTPEKQMNLFSGLFSFVGPALPAFVFCGGERGIRTPGTLMGSTVFETAPFDRSGISPFIMGCKVCNCSSVAAVCRLWSPQLCGGHCAGRTLFSSTTNLPAVSGQSGITFLAPFKGWQR